MTNRQKSMYMGAPGMLMDRIHEVNALLANSLIKTGETDSYKFWKRTCDIMKYAWDYMQNLNWVIRENEHLRLRCEYLEARLIKAERLNDAYEIIRELKLQGVFEQRVQVVDTFMELALDKTEGVYRD